MSKLRDLIGQGPELCGVKGINAQRWSKKYLDIFDEEVANPDSLFASFGDEKVEDRLNILTGLYMASGAKHSKVAYWIGLVILCAYSYAVAKGMDKLGETRDHLAGVLSVQESSNVEIASVMSVADASTLTFWD